MQVYVENKRGQRFRVIEGWQNPGTIFENDASAELLVSFPPSALDQIYDQFLARNGQCSIDTYTLGESISLRVTEFPGVPAHFSSEHKAVYTAVRNHQILVEEAPFGEAVLEEQQSGLRHKIRLVLQKIVAEERIEAARIQAVHEKRSELEKVGAHIARGAQGFGEAVWGLAVWAKDIAEVAMVVRSTRVQYEMLGATYDYFARDKDFDASGNEYLGDVKKEVVDVLGFDPSTITAEQLKQAFEVAELIYDDTTLRSDIGRFAKDYVKAQHSLEISEFAGGGVFEIILTIVLAVFTGGVGAVGSMAKNARLMFRFKDVGDLMLDFAKYQKQRLRLSKSRGANSSPADFSDFDTIDVSVRKEVSHPSGASRSGKTTSTKETDSGNDRTASDDEKDVFHATGNPQAAQGIVDGIDPKFLNPNSRFGAAFYVAEAPGTTLVELAHHGASPTHGIRFELNSANANILDLTDPKVAKSWNYTGGPISSSTQAIGAKAREKGFNVIRYPSERDVGGVNNAVLDDFEKLLTPQFVSPAKP